MSVDRLLRIAREAVTEDHERDIRRFGAAGGASGVRVALVLHAVLRRDQLLQRRAEHARDVDRLLRVARRVRPGCAGYHTTTRRPPARCSVVKPTAYGPVFAYGAADAGSRGGGLGDVDGVALRARSPTSRTRPRGLSRRRTRSAMACRRDLLDHGRGVWQTSRRSARCRSSGSELRRPNRARGASVRAVKGETELLGDWVGARYARAYRTAVLICGNPADAEEAVQDAFLRAWRFRDALPDTERRDAWLYRVLVNACYSKLRKEVPRRDRERETLDPDGGPSATTESPEVGPSGRCSPTR